MSFLMVNSSSLLIYYIFFTYISIFGIQVVLTPSTVKVDAINMVVQLFPQDSCFNFWNKCSNYCYQVSREAGLEAYFYVNVIFNCPILWLKLKSYKEKQAKFILRYSFLLCLIQKEMCWVFLYIIFLYWTEMKFKLSMLSNVYLEFNMFQNLPTQKENTFTYNSYFI